MFQTPQQMTRSNPPQNGTYMVHNASNTTLTFRDGGWLHGCMAAWLLDDLTDAYREHLFMYHVGIGCDQSVPVDTSAQWKGLRARAERSSMCQPGASQADASARFIPIWPFNGINAYLHSYHVKQGTR